MKVFVGSSGFCAGVKRAVDTALTVSPEGTYILGELVHNPLALARVAARGIRTVQSLDEVPSGARLLIRSHGVGRAVYAACEEREIKVVDCTCAFVRRTQEIVRRESAAGRTVVIAGHRDHPEVQGLIGWAEGGAVRVVSSVEDEFTDLTDKDVVLVAQTTFSEKYFCKIGENLQKGALKSLVIFPTICYTTVARQREVAQLAAECDAVIVIGGLNSSNTKRLGEIASAHCKNVFMIADVGDFEYETLKNFGRVGVIAGASTPDWLTQEVLFKMAENNAEVLKTETQLVEEVKVEEAAPAAVETKAEESEAPVSAMQKFMDDFDKEERYKKGDRIKVTIVSATDDGIFVSGKGKLENRIPKEELDCEEYSREVYEEKARNGVEIEVIVTAVKPTQLSEKLLKKYAEEDALLADIIAGKEFSVVCKGTNKGGLTSELGTYSVFIPRKEIRIGYVTDLEKYVGKTLRLKVKDPEKDIRKTGRKEIIASQRVILEVEREEREAAKAAKEENFFSSIQVGDVVEGKVERVTSFGAFVSVNGFDCLAHISDLSWTGVKEVTDVLEIGKRYEFQILKIDRNTKKVSIGYKQLQPQPWDLAAEKYAEGDVIHGRVVRIVPFGAFVEIEKGIDGLVHVSQITHEWLENPTSALTIGEEVDAKIIAFNPAERKITLSIKALQERPEYEPRPEREPREDGQRRERGNRKGGRRAAQSFGEEEEYREWTEGSSFGASISELLGNDDK